MIITSHLAWYHLPKTAGTSTDQLFVATGLPLLWHDSQSSPVKHLPPHEHTELPQLPLQGRHAVANFRRLPAWLLSNLHHKTGLMGLELDPEPMRRGLFWRARLQQWLPADWWLERFGIDEQWTLLRVERLKADFLACLAQHEPIGWRARWRVQRAQASNRNHYRRNLSAWFTAADLQAVYAANPRWAALEQRLYGDLQLDPAG
jgi:hypothetical protein